MPQSSLQLCRDFQLGRIVAAAVKWPLRVPKLFNLRTDPFERADITSNTYYDWFLRRDFFVFYATAMASAFLDTFKEFPPRHPPASFSIDQIVKKLEEFLAAD
jgi:arylsulfatase